MFTINVSFAEYVIKEDEDGMNEYGELENVESVLDVLLLKEEQIEEERRRYAAEFEVSTDVINTYHLK
jgi:hypothetical protein